MVSVTSPIHPRAGRRGYYSTSPTARQPHPLRGRCAEWTLTTPRGREREARSTRPRKPFPHPHEPRTGDITIEANVTRPACDGRTAQGHRPFAPRGQRQRHPIQALDEMLSVKPRLRGRRDGHPSHLTHRPPVDPDAPSIVETVEMPSTPSWRSTRAYPPEKRDRRWDESRSYRRPPPVAERLRRR